MTQYTVTPNFISQH